jgi:hypothetical protein
MEYFQGCCILCVHTFGFIVRVLNYDIQPEPFLRFNPARNLISTPFIQAEVLQIQEKKRKGKFPNASNEKELRLTVSTSNFVSLMGYEGLVGTVVDSVKVWVPRSVMPKGIFGNRPFIPQAGLSKAEDGYGEGPSVATESRLLPVSGASDDIIEISSDEEPSDQVAKTWLGFLDLTAPEPEGKLQIRKKNRRPPKSLI